MIELHFDIDPEKICLGERQSQDINYDDLTGQSMHTLKIIRTVKTFKINVN